MKKKDPNKQTQSFKEYCEKNLSSYDFRNLHTIAKVSKHMITIMLNNPRKINLPVLNVLSNGLRIEPLNLIDRFNCGLDGMTAQEYRQLLNQTKKTHERN